MIYHWYQDRLGTNVTTTEDDWTEKTCGVPLRFSSATFLSPPPRPVQDVEFFFGHGLYNSSLHDAIVKECGDYKTPSDK